MTTNERDPFLTAVELTSLLDNTCHGCPHNLHVVTAASMLEALPEGFGVTSLTRIMTAVNPTVDAMLMAMQTPRPLNPTKAHGFIDTDPHDTTGQSVSPEGTRVGYNGRDDYLLYLHTDDDTMTLGRDVVGEWHDGSLHLSSPHTPDKFVITSASRYLKPGGPNFLALPLIERLLADPTARISIWDEA